MGHIYVIEFANGIVKVGQTADPEYRLVSLREKGNPITQRWVSGDLGARYKLTEGYVIGWAKKYGTVTKGREYFSGLGFDRAVTLARQIIEDIRFESATYGHDRTQIVVRGGIPFDDLRKRFMRRAPDNFLTKRQTQVLRPSFAFIDASTYMWCPHCHEGIKLRRECSGDDPTIHKMFSLE
jgi:hypothetical protein